MRRLFEPVATGVAASRITAAELGEVRRHLEAMRAAKEDVELLNQHDAAFHRAVIAATGNQTLASLLEGISSRTVRARVWRGLVDDDVADRTLAGHQAIFEALAARPRPSSTSAPPSGGCATTRGLRRAFVRVGVRLPRTPHISYFSRYSTL